MVAYACIACVCEYVHRPSTDCGIAVHTQCVKYAEADCLPSKELVPRGKIYAPRVGSVRTCAWTCVLAIGTFYLQATYCIIYIVLYCIINITAFTSMQCTAWTSRLG